MRLLARLSRRLVAGGALWLAATGLAAQTLAANELRAAGDPALQRSLEAVVHDLGLDGALANRQLSLALVDVTDAHAPRLAMLNGDEMMYAASLPKIGILVGALAEAESGRLPLDAPQLQAMHNMIRHSSNADASR
ncbi:MAG: hypothetical protein MUF08_15635, partial [Burkholderiaceae bacterium]|nr:hypothetical protein [Burkholderiaceae bacterium]